MKKEYLKKNIVIHAVMPPLFEEETTQDSNDKRKGPSGCSTMYSGGSCENVIKAFLLRNNINYSKPAVDDGLDLYVLEPGLERAQIKKIVYKNKLDKPVSKSKGIDVYRSVYDFRFQSCKDRHNARTKENTDVFYHVLNTCYRTLIFKVPTKNLSTVANGLFPKMKNVILDRSFRKGKSIKDVDIRKCLVSAQYDPIVFQTYPEFFTPQNTIMNFMS